MNKTFKGSTGRGLITIRDSLAGANAFKAKASIEVTEINFLIIAFIIKS